MATKKVVIIDDDPRLAHMLSDLLEVEGFETMALTRGKEAVALCTSWEPDLVILDILMPEMSGWEVLQELKATRATRDIPVIIHSASPLESQNVVELSRYEDVLVLPKPWDVGDLLKKVDEVISARPV